jgi:hypothetical protein
LIVVVTTVVDDPEPSVYVRTTDSDCDAPLEPLAATVGAVVMPVPRGTVAAAEVWTAVTPGPRGTEEAPADVAVAEYEARAAELADSASATGQTVWKH